MTTATPCSDYIETRGLVFFARMLDKIRLHAAGRLRHGYNIGMSEPSCFDARFCRFWEVDYDRIRESTLAGKSNEEVLTAILGSGPLNPERVLAWNALILKRGWRDDVSAELEEVKRAHGLGARPDIQTFVDFHDVDEGRTPQNALP